MFQNNVSPDLKTSNKVDKLIMITFNVELHRIFHRYLV